MKKIISLFQRNYEGDRNVRDEIVPGAEWVINGEGIATRKYDGTCCMVRDGQLFRRYTVKGKRQPPPDFEPATDPDPVTGKQEGWIPVGDGYEDKYHREAFEKLRIPVWEGTYELVGPKVQGNPEKFEWHMLIPHGIDTLMGHEVPRDFDGLRSFLMKTDIEGIVWHHDDGRMVKIKAKDFGLKRGVMR